MRQKASSTGAETRAYKNLPNPDPKCANYSKLYCVSGYPRFQECVLTLLPAVFGEFCSILSLFGQLDSAFSGLFAVTSGLPFRVSWANISSGYLR